MKTIAFRLYGAGLVACVSVASGALVGCASDDTAMGPPPKMDSGPDTTMADSSSGDSSSEAASDSTSDVTADAPPVDSPSDSPADSPTTDSPADAAPKTCTPIKLCETFDKIWGIIPDGGEPSACATETTGACPQRGGSYGVSIVYAFGTGPAFADCRIKEILGPVGQGGLVSEAGEVNYPNDLNAYVFKTLGCPVVSGADGGAEAGSGFDAGVLPPLGVISPSIEGDVFTSAELNLLAYYWSQAIQTAVLEQAGDGGTELTKKQIKEINDEIACDTTIEPGEVPSCNFPHSTCVAEAGPPDAGPSDATCD